MKSDMDKSKKVSLRSSATAVPGVGMVQTNSQRRDLAQLRCGRKFTVVTIFLLLALTGLNLSLINDADGQSTWVGTGSDFGDWNTASNWSPATLPSTTAIFGSTGLTSVNLSSNVTIGTIQFSDAAQRFDLFVTAFSSPVVLDLTADGIIGNAANQTLFVLQRGILVFDNASSAGNVVISQQGGTIQFNGTSTAGTAQITQITTAITLAASNMSFAGFSTAGSSTINVGSGNTVSLTDASTLGTSTVTISSGGTMALGDTASAANSHIANSGVLNYSGMPTLALVSLLTMGK